MVPLMIRAGVWLGSAAIGLLVAKLVLDDMTIDLESSLLVTLIFAILQSVLAPFFTKMAASRASALLGGVGMLATFAALLITSVVSDGMSINGVDTWVFASLIVWIVTMLGSFSLPLLVGKRMVGDASGHAGV